MSRALGLRLVMHVFPIGFSPGNICRANASLTMHTAGECSARSPASNSRPAAIGTPIVAK